ncbi:hypothetical protein TNCT_678251 [Trichonephila clavata]|uniref:Uncharacterized protein n=1 Tax=Trichonephila clavata TaxID=2740835 RepID=A0A8X6LNY3_TRICU|nr:hypothetical protein TNCT_678251 [Trichonephila clavata]
MFSNCSLDSSILKMISNSVVSLSSTMKALTNSTPGPSIKTILYPVILANPFALPDSIPDPESAIPDPESSILDPDLPELSSLVISPDIPDSDELAAAGCCRNSFSICSSRLR